MVLDPDDRLPYQLSAEEETDLDEAEAEIARGELADEAAVRAVLRKYDNYQPRKPV